MILWRLPLLVLLLPLAAGCERAMQNMYDQPKYKPLTASPLWSDGKSSRPLEPGVVAHSAGALAATSSGRMAQLAPPSPAPTVLPLDDRGISRVNPIATAPSETTRPIPTAVTMALLQRGRNRFDIYCAPCHSVSGDGDGMVVRRGFPRPEALSTAKLRAAPDSHLFDVVTNGYGVMYPFGDRIASQDRWAIVAYVRALQFSQDARLEDVPADQRRAIEEQR